jgi:hypothetical protein
MREMPGAAAKRRRWSAAGGGAVSAGLELRAAQAMVPPERDGLQEQPATAGQWSRGQRAVRRR